MGENGSHECQCGRACNGFGVHVFERVASINVAFHDRIKKLETEWAAATEAYESIYVKCRKLEDRLERITTKANEQAEDVALWAVYPTGTQPITEAYIQQELRALHRVIEENT